MFARLLVVFVTVPLIEVILFMEIGERIGLAATVATIILTAVLGAWLTRLEGLRALARFQQATAEGRLPHEEVMDGVMILVAAVVLLTPGFFTDAVGFLLLVPPVRAFIRGRVGRALMKKLRVEEAAVRMEAAPAPPSGSGQARREEKIVEAEVIDEERR